MTQQVHRKIERTLPQSSSANPSGVLGRPGSSKAAVFDLLALSRFRLVSCLMAMLWASLWVSAADAQNALGGGRALDANLRVGSGGYNPGAEADEPVPGRYADAVITGNVGGLHRFRGRIGYRASGDFSGSTASDRTFRFNLRSLSPGQSPWSSGNLIIRRPGSGAQAADLLPHNTTEPVVRPEATGVEVTTPGTGPRLGMILLPPTSADPNPERRGRLLQKLGVAPLSGLGSGASGPVPSAQEEDAEAEEDPLGAHFRARIDQIHPQTVLSLGAQLSKEKSVTADLPPVDLSERAMDAMFRPPGFDRSRPGQDSYFDLLRRIGGNRQVPEAAPDKTSSVAADRSGTGLGAEPEEDQQTGESQSRSIRKLIEKLSHDLPPVQSLAGQQPSPFNRVMQQAESAMRAGRYFEAERFYARALLLRSGHPLAEAGRVHAQLGSGLFLSAAHNLRQLLGRNAVVISTRFGSSLLPDPERLKAITLALKQNLDQALRAEKIRRRRFLSEGRRPPPPSVSKTGPALLLAYLAYQQKDLVACREAFEAMEQLDPADPLAPLLRRLWLRPDSGTGSTPSRSRTPLPDPLP
ncbi:MAG: hypothetical protein R3236_04830, partial [Phycisphaeraceae bacterium]|nr:hypothetical protein [Phycisphaeraceae bacterium]